MWPLGFSRVDVVAWLSAVVVGIIGTVIASAAGARLGAALTLGVILAMVIVIAAMLIDARGRSFRDGD
jgi:nicotinamide riboside transporter PnuC